MAPDQVDLQLVQLVGRDPDVRQLAEAGVDPVDRLPRRDRGLDQASAAHQLGAGGRIEGHENARRPGGADDLRHGERAAVECERGDGHRPEHRCPGRERQGALRRHSGVSQEAAAGGHHELGIAGIGLEGPVEHDERLAHVGDPERAVALEPVLAIHLEDVAEAGHRQDPGRFVELVRGEVDARQILHRARVVRILDAGAGAERSQEEVPVQVPIQEEVDAADRARCGSAPAR